jgi:hypothetical protein
LPYYGNANYYAIGDKTFSSKNVYFWIPFISSAIFQFLKKSLVYFLYFFASRDKYILQYKIFQIFIH